MKIAFFEIRDWEKKILKQLVKGHSLSFYGEPLTEENSKKAGSADVISVFIHSKINLNILRKLPKLKLITTRSTGFDHINIKECKKRKIKVMNVPTYGENTVAEHTFALLLAMSRKVHKSYLRTIKNDFTIDGLKGFDLKGRTLGVLGVGKIGKHVIRIARGFEMSVLAYDRNPDEFLAEQLNFRYVPLKQMLKKSDIVTIHIPYTKENHHLINKKTLPLFKKGAILLNTSRGAIIDNEALLLGLKKRIFSGLGLDVIEGEKLIEEEFLLSHEEDRDEAIQTFIEDHKIIDNENVVFTPHIAFFSQEALERILEQTAENINSFVAGKPTSSLIS